MQKGQYKCKIDDLRRVYLHTVCSLDQNECLAGSHKCSIHAKCVNTIGSHKCQCKSGFKGDGLACDDVNECDLGEHNCNQPGTRCVNTPGAFECQCKPGYSGSARTGCYGKCNRFLPSGACQIWAQICQSRPPKMSTT